MDIGDENELGGASEIKVAETKKMEVQLSINNNIIITTASLNFSKILFKHLELLCCFSGISAFEIAQAMQKLFSYYILTVFHLFGDEGRQLMLFDDSLSQSMEKGKDLNSVFSLCRFKSQFQNLMKDVFKT